MTEHTTPKRQSTYQSRQLQLQYPELRRCHKNFKVNDTGSRSKEAVSHKYASLHVFTRDSSEPKVWRLQFQYFTHRRCHKNYKVKVTASRSKVIVAKNTPLHTHPSSVMCIPNFDTVAKILWTQQAPHEFQGQGHSFEVKGVGDLLV